MASKRGKISKHGTLGEGDLSDAVPIDLDKVLQSTKSPSTKHLFGDVAALPPKSAQVSFTFSSFLLFSIDVVFMIAEMICCYCYYCCCCLP